MDVVAKIYGGKVNTPLTQYSKEALLVLWNELLRNRNYAHVLKLLDGTLESDTASELRILEVDTELRSRDIDLAHR